MGQRERWLAIGVVLSAVILALAWGRRLITISNAEFAQARQAQRTFLQNAAKIDGSANAISSEIADPLTLVRQTLADAQIAAEKLRSVRPQGERKLPGSNQSRRSVSIQLTQMSMGELGNWFASWQSPGNLWRVLDIQCTQRPTRGEARQNYDVLITCYVDHAE